MKLRVLAVLMLTLTFLSIVTLLCTPDPLPETWEPKQTIITGHIGVPKFEIKHIECDPRTRTVKIEVMPWQGSGATKESITPSKESATSSW